MLAVGAVSERQRGHLAVGQNATMRFIDGQHDERHRVTSSASAPTRRRGPTASRRAWPTRRGDRRRRDLRDDGRRSIRSRRRRCRARRWSFRDDGRLGVRIADEKSQARFMPVAIVDDGREFGLGDRHRQGAVAGHRGRPGLRQGRRPGRGGQRGGCGTAEGGAAGVRRIVDFAIGHARLTLAILVFLLIAGLSSYLDDSRRKPSRTSRSRSSTSSFPSAASRPRTPSGCSSGRWRRSSSRSPTSRRCARPPSRAAAIVLLEFEAGFDSDVALQDVRAKVDDAKRDLPADADEPSVHEVNLSLFPVIVVTLSGDLSERALGHDRARGPGRHRAGAGRALGRPQGHARRGRRDHRRADAAEELRRVARPVRRRPPRKATAWSRPARSRAPQGRFAVKVPALIETPEDVLADPGRRVERRDRSRSATSPTIKPTFKDATSITRVDGRPAVAIEVVQARRRQPHRDRRRRQGGDRQPAEARWPAAASRSPSSRTSRRSSGSCSTDLQNSVLTACPPGRRHHPVRPRRARLDLHRHRHSGLVPGRHPRPRTWPG